MHSPWQAQYFTSEACQCWRVVFSWQAQHFVLVHFTIPLQAQHFVTWPRCCFDELRCQGCANMTQCQKSWQGQHFCELLEKWRQLRKDHIYFLLSFVKIALLKKLAGNCRFSASKLQNWRESHKKSSFLKLL